MGIDLEPFQPLHLCSKQPCETQGGEETVEKKKK